jgi:hypothetical protein
MNVYLSTQHSMNGEASATNPCRLRLVLQEELLDRDENGRMTLCAHGSIQNGTRQDVKGPVIKANNKIAMKMASCYMQQNVPSLQRHQ